jgi:hypothetical protein
MNNLLVYVIDNLGSIIKKYNASLLSAMKHQVNFYCLTILHTYMKFKNITKFRKWPFTCLHKIKTMISLSFSLIKCLK